VTSDSWIKALIANASQSVKERRETLGWTIYRAAAEAGLSWLAVKQVERGERRPSLETFCRLAAGLQMKPSELLAEIEKQSEHTQKIPKK